MKILADVKNPDSLLLEIRHKVIRCDLCTRWVSMLEKESLLFRQIMTLNEYQEVIDFDKENLFIAFKDLIKYFTVDPSSFRRVYLHKKKQAVQFAGIRRTVD